MTSNERSLFPRLITSEQYDETDAVVIEALFILNREVRYPEHKERLKEILRTCPHPKHTAGILCKLRDVGLDAVGTFIMLLTKGMEFLREQGSGAVIDTSYRSIFHGHGVIDDIHLPMPIPPNTQEEDLNLLDQHVRSRKAQSQPKHSYGGIQKSSRKSKTSSFTPSRKNRAREFGRSLLPRLAERRDEVTGKHVELPEGAHIFPVAGVTNPKASSLFDLIRIFWKPADVLQFEESMRNRAAINRFENGLCLSHITHKAFDKLKFYLEPDEDALKRWTMGEELKTYKVTFVWHDTLDKELPDLNDHWSGQRYEKDSSGGDRLSYYIMKDRQVITLKTSDAAEYSLPNPVFLHMRAALQRLSLPAASAGPIDPDYSSECEESVEQSESEAPISEKTSIGKDCHLRTNVNLSKSIVPHKRKYDEMIGRNNTEDRAFPYNHYNPRKRLNSKILEWLDQ